MKNTKVKYHTNIQQRSQEWLNLRLGKVGGSESIGLTTTARMKSLIPLKVAELLTGEHQGDDFVSKQMQYGIDTEPIARAEYEKQMFTSVTECGYITHEDYPLLGLSVDGLVGDVGAIEIKCPAPKAHIAIIVSGKVPTAYRPQLAQTFVVNETLEWIDFVSFNNTLKQRPMYIIKVSRQDMEKDIKVLKSSYETFSNAVEESIKIIKQL